MNRMRLPARALRLSLSSRAGAIVGMVMLALLGLGSALGAVYFIRSGADIRADQRVWEHGVTATSGDVRATRTSKLIPWLMANYDGTASYVDERGQRHEGDISFWTMLGGPDVDVAEVRYDRDDPSRFATSWGVEASGARWRAIVVVTLILALCTWAGFAGMWWVGGDDRKRRRAAAQGDEVELRIVSVNEILVKGQPSKKLRYELELAVDGQMKRIYRDAAALLTFGDHRTLGLWIAPNTEQLVVMDPTLAPLVISEAERHEVLARL